MSFIWNCPPSEVTGAQAPVTPRIQSRGDVGVMTPAHPRGWCAATIMPVGEASSFPTLFGIMP